MIQRQAGENFGEWRLILRPNASLSVCQARMLVAGIGLVMTGIGAGFAAVGAWPVLPFSGGELLLLIYALGCSMRQNAVCEVITLEQDRIRIERKNPASSGYCHEFIRAWVRVGWLPGPSRRLVIGSHGKWVEIGAFLGEEEKCALAQTLQRQACALDFQ